MGRSVVAGPGVSWGLQPCRSIKSPFPEASFPALLYQHRVCGGGGLAATIQGKACTAVLVPLDTVRLLYVTILRKHNVMSKKEVRRYYPTGLWISAEGLCLFVSISSPTQEI